MSDSECDSDSKVKISESQCDSDSKVKMSEFERDSDSKVKRFESESKINKWEKRNARRQAELDRLKSLPLEVAVREVQDRFCDLIVHLINNADQRDVAVKAAVEHERWKIVAKVLDNDTLRQKMGKCPLSRWAVEEASKGCNEEYSLSRDYWEIENPPLLRILKQADPDQYPALLDELSARRKWCLVNYILGECRIFGNYSDKMEFKYVTSEQVIQVMDRACDDPNEDALSSIVSSCPPEYRCHLMFKAARNNHKKVVGTLMSTFCQGVFLSSFLADALIEATTKPDNTKAEHVGKGLPSNSVFEEISGKVLSFIRARARSSSEHKRNKYSFEFTRLPEYNETEKSENNVFIQNVSNVIENAHDSWKEYTLDSFETFLINYMEGPREDHLLIQFLFVLPSLGGPIQNKALKEFIGNASPRGVGNDYLSLLFSSVRWGDIQFVCLPHVWEQVRRELFEAALEQKQWDLVRLWSDHSLYDDQRLWALDQAYKHQQWGVMLRLADHGLTEVERMRVINRLGKFADWDTTLEMFEHGVDIVEMREMLQAAMKRRKEETNHRQYAERRESLKHLQPRIFCLSESFENLLAKSNWRAVLHRLRKRPNNKRFMKTLQQAIEECVWHVVIQVVRLGITAGQRDSLLTRMLEMKQWEIVRELLEQGVSVQLCKDMLPELLHRKQWVLVAKIMNYDDTDEQRTMITDEMRRQIMETALESQEGSLVWHCISRMKSEISEEDRIRIFETALKDNNWQAVKVAVEREADPRHEHRTKALLEAIKQHRWDVVDHCMLFKADVDRDTLSKRNETAMHRAAREKDWRAVEELVCRGANTLLEDRNGDRVMDKALESKGSPAPKSTLKTLIEFHAPLCQPNKHDQTPLQILIERRYGELIDTAILWCPDLHKGITVSGETAVHAVCASGCWQAMRWLIARGVDPLHLTHNRESAMAYCLLDGVQPQRTLAESIKLGLGTYQRIISDDCFCNKPSDPEVDPSWEVNSERVRRLLIAERKSPFEYAVCQGKRVLLKMLYESGACSNKELFEVYRDILYVGKRKDLDEDPWWYKDKSRNLILDKMLPTIHQMATTPRTLKSLCRLVISHCLGILTRHWEVKSLKTLDQDMQDYVTFTDLTDPNYGKELIPWEEELAQDVQTLETRLKEERYKTFSRVPFLPNDEDSWSSPSSSESSEHDFSALSAYVSECHGFVT